MRYYIKKENEQTTYMIPVNGVDKQDIKLQSLEQEIQLEVNKKITIPEGFSSILEEFETSKQSQVRIPVDQQLDMQSIQAQVEEGLLSITLSPKVETNPQSITIH